MARPRLLIATTSAGKLREWQGLLGDLPVELARLSDIGIDFDVDETGSTFRENAVLKADAYGQASGLLTLAEDSGLCVAALGGGPGVHSARWEGPDYEHKNRQQQIEFVRKKAAQLGLQVTLAQVHV